MKTRLPLLIPFFRRLALWLPSLALAADPPDPSFDFSAILNDPLNAQTIQTETVAGIVYETVEFTSQTVSGTPVRVRGILGRLPSEDAARRRPAIFFSMPGMAPASAFWSGLFARKGYVALTLTLPAPPLPPPPPFQGQTLRDGHLTAFAVAQMRGITYLTQRPEVDSARIGIGGSSYGGFFATLIAGADPRIQAGMSFFAGGRHELGTHLPQFTGLTDRRQIELWTQTLDPAWRLRRRAVPFLWGVAANDHWFPFPAVIATARDSIGEKRLAILPHWNHGFPPNIDQQLIDWFDVYLARPEDQGLPPVRPAYNQAGELSVRREVKGLTAAWTVTGSRPVSRAELVVSFGPDRPWHGWVYRLHQPFPARFTAPSEPGAPTLCEAALPVPDPDLPLVVYGQAFDEQGGLISTLPQTLVPRQRGIESALDAPELNACPWGDFEPEWTTLLAGCGLLPGQADTAIFKSGSQSLRLGPFTGRTVETGAALNLLHVPTRAHRLTGWIRVQPEASVEIRLRPLAPQDWDRPGGAIARQAFSDDTLPTPADLESLSRALTLTGGSRWQSFSLEGPAPSLPIEGYQLVIRPGATNITCWLDEVRFTPCW